MNKPKTSLFLRLPAGKRGLSKKHEKRKYGIFVNKYIKNRKTTAIHQINSLKYNDLKRFWKKIKQMINPN